MSEYQEYILNLTNRARERPLTGIETGILRSEGQVAELQEINVDLVKVVEDMLSGLKYLYQTKQVPYGFGIDRLEETGKAALAKAGKEAKKWQRKQR